MVQRKLDADPEMLLTRVKKGKFEKWPGVDPVDFVPDPLIGR